MDKSLDRDSEDPTDRATVRSGSGSGGAGMDPLDRDLLVSRVVDGVASSADWAALDDLARTESSIWRDLAQAQRCNTRNQKKRNQLSL